MGIFDVFFGTKKNTASVAKNRLQILIKEEHDARGASNKMESVRKKIIARINEVLAEEFPGADMDAVKVDVMKDDGHDVLGISIALPDDKDKPAD